MVSLANLLVTFSSITSPVSSTFSFTCFNSSCSSPSLMISSSVSPPAKSCAISVSILVLTLFRSSSSFLICAMLLSSRPERSMFPSSSLFLRISEAFSLAFSAASCLATSLSFFARASMAAFPLVTYSFHTFSPKVVRSNAIASASPASAFLSSSRVFLRFLSISSYSLDKSLSTLPTSSPP